MAFEPPAVAGLRHHLSVHVSAATAKISAYLPSLEPSPDADKVAEILLHHHNPFHSLESTLQLHGISLSPPLLHQTLLRLVPYSKVSLSLFEFSRRSLDAPITPTSYSILIHSLSLARQFDAVWKLIVGMSQDSIELPKPAFRLFIRRLVSAGLTRQALRAFDDIPCFCDCFVSDAEDNIYLIDTLCKYGHVRIAAQVFKEKMKSAGSLFGHDAWVRVYSVLVYGWCKIGRVDMAERLLTEMVENGIEPNVVTYNILLNGICRRAWLSPDYRFEKVLRAADKVFEEMRERGIEPDVTSYSTVLHVYSRAHKPALVMDKLKEMKETGICPSLATYTSVIKCLVSCGRLREGEELIEEMVSKGVSPSAATYNCFFKEYRGRKDADAAISLYRRMKGMAGEVQSNVMCKPSMQTYNLLLSMFVKLDRMRLAEEVWEDMKVSGMGPDLDSYTLLIHDLCSKERWKQACRFFVEMIETGILPQKETFEMLYRGLIQSDKLRTWRRLKKRLDEESIAFANEFPGYHIKPYRR
ncbi:hypothetical protein MLD38_028416 [Melastoma candidum]|uniref:Uncharacterized protein n=1 Tax=Melastoma candidum TaxID=119954 RepID=A0ACB9N3A8_9MYRT|nr:hypothetical protein MLD38_028416 [Melastoma candidum]